MIRADWQQIAEERLFAAQALLVAGRWPSAYYLAGYAVECGLKSCVVARVSIEPHLIFVEKKYSEQCWTHDIEQLVKLAGLTAIRDTDAAANAAFGQNWNTVGDWSEHSRYQLKTQAEAQLLYDAIAHTVDGVMQWIKVRW